MTTPVYAMAKTVPAGRDYLTAGKPYLVTVDHGGRLFGFADSRAEYRWGSWKRDYHYLDGADWTRLTEAEALAIMAERMTPGTSGPVHVSAPAMRLEAASPPGVPADLWREELSSLIAAAYADGCTDTHAAWEAGVAGSADDFGEAASDYAFGKHEVIDALLTRVGEMGL